MNAGKTRQKLTGGQVVREKGVIGGFGPEHCRRTLFAATDTPGGSGTSCIALLDLRLALSLGPQFVDGRLFWRASQPDEGLRGCASRLDAERAVGLLGDPHFVASV